MEDHDFEKLLDQREAAHNSGKAKQDKGPSNQATRKDSQPGALRPFYMPYYIYTEEENRKPLAISQHEKELVEQHKEEAVRGDAEWNEEYEQTSDKLLLKFQEALRRRPDQFLRYSFRGDPLWMTAAVPASIPVCERCGAERVFELQLLSTLVYFLEQQKKRNPYGRRKGTPINTENTADSAVERGLEFGCLAVYVCSDSCGPEGGPIPEYAFTQQTL